MKRFLLCAGVLALAGTAFAAGPTLDMIEPLGADTASSGRAVLCPATHAVAFGQSGTATGIVYDGTTRWVLSSDNAGSTIVTGAGYRMTPGGRQLVAHGMTTSGHTLYSSMNDGVTWGVKVRLTNTFLPFTIGASNTLAASGADDKAFYGFPWGTGSSRQLEMVTAAGAGAAPDYLPTQTLVQASTTSDEGSVRGVSYTSSLASNPALGVGKRGANAYYVTSLGAKGALNTLNGTAGEAWSIAKDGTKIFGYSTVTDGRTGLYPWMSTGGIPGTAVELPGLPGALNNANNGVPYGASEDGKYAVGMSYPGTEKAVLWDTVAMTVTDLNDLFASQLAAQGFTRLSRAYSVTDIGDGRLAIAGQGAWSADGVTFYTRGFVGVTPEPASLAFLVLGALPLLRRRR